jgi:IclR family transcriptional regulator, KDG regulon repressor
MDTVQPGSNTVHRAMAVLLALSDAPPEGLGVSELTRRVGANRSTVYRIIDALKTYGFVRPGDAPGTVRLGFGLVELADSVLSRLDVREVAAPYLRALSDRTGETCHLAVLDELEVVYVDKAESDQAMHLTSRPGKRQPLHCTSLGKSFLAAMTPERLRDTLDRIELVARTNTTITDRQRLEDELRLVARRGWATDIGENTDGVNCVGAAIYGREPFPVAAISASAPAHRFSRENIAEYGPMVAATVQEISRELGHTKPATASLVS